MYAKPEPQKKRRGHRDPVTPDVYGYVVARDGFWCVAPSLDAEDPCADRWGNLLRYSDGHWTSDGLTLDHVRDEPMIGKRAPSDARHLVLLCWHHHLNGWATANRPILRAYIKRVEDEQAARRIARNERRATA